ncbi:hypothetical protein [Rhodococcus jostii]|uniref:hypothetical protein n=1 Tax=Rhodococcus jostii TaxID=132919 RepID=UPI003645EDF0
MTANPTTRARRMASPRKLLYTPLAVSILASAVCAGTGIGTAATPLPAPDTVTASSSTPDTPSESALPGWEVWSLYNRTGQPIYGTWSQQTEDRRSEVKIIKDAPLPDGGYESQPQKEGDLWNTSWEGHICYNREWWTLPSGSRNVDNNAVFALRAVNGGLQATWNPIRPGAPSEATLDLNLADGPC